MGTLFEGRSKKVVEVAGAAAVTFLALFLLGQALLALREYASPGAGLSGRPTIVVNGTGEVFAIPDIAEFSFSTDEEGETVEVAQGKSAEKINAAIDYLKENGVEERDIKTVNYSAYPNYEYEQIYCITYPCPGGKSVFKGFKVSQSVSVKVRDTEKAGELLSGIGETGVSNISGLSFTIDDQDAVDREAREEAIADAKEKAKLLAKDLGVSLGRIVSFNDGGYAGAYYSYDSVKSEAAIGRGGAPTPSIPTGENKIVSNVTIVYEIR